MLLAESCMGKVCKMDIKLYHIIFLLAWSHFKWKPISFCSIYGLLLCYIVCYSETMMFGESYSIGFYAEWTSEWIYQLQQLSFELFYFSDQVQYLYTHVVRKINNTLNCLLYPRGNTFFLLKISLLNNMFGKRCLLLIPQIIAIKVNVLINVCAFWSVMILSLVLAQIYL